MAKSNKKTPTQKRSFIELIDNFCEAKQIYIFIVSLLLTLIFSLLLFDVRVSLTGDDSMYILNAYNFIEESQFPGWQGPLYPFFLTPFIAIFGVKVIALKTLSLLCIMGFLTFSFLALRKRIPAFLLSSFLILTSINSEVLYYASQTYSEAFYMLVASITFWYYFVYFLDKEPSKIHHLPKIMLLAFLFLCMGLTRSVGFIGIIAFVIFGCFNFKRWKENILIIISFIGLFFLWSGLKSWIWGSEDAQFSSQLQSLLQKEAYNPNAGQEDFVGFLQRFKDNTRNYISYHFYEIIGIYNTDDIIQGKFYIGILTFIWALIGLIFAGKKNKPLLLIGLYTGGFLVLTFFLLQVFWNQSRLIIPVLPYLLLCLLTTFYFLSKLKYFKWMQIVLVVIVFILILTGLNRSSSKIKEAQKITDEYYGLTPDWSNYLKASVWAANNLPKDEMIACRKPSISFIYADRKFRGIPQVPSFPSDTLQNRWNTSKNTIVAYPQQILNNNYHPSFRKELLQNLSCYYIANQMYCIFENQDSIIIKNLIKNLKPLSEPIQDFSSLPQDSKSFIIYPDSLLNSLKENNVHHVITASLRINPAKKTDRIINTVERYLHYIEIKYPGIFIQEQQIGNNNNEPARVFKVDYSKTY